MNSGAKSPMDSNQQAKLRKSNKNATKKPSGGKNAVAVQCSATTCTTKTLIIQDDNNKKRSYKLSVDINDPKKNPQGNLIQMIGDWKENPAKAKFVFPQCGTKPSIFLVKGENVEKPVDKNNAIVDLFGKQPANNWAVHTFVPFSVFLEDFLWPTSVKPNRYSVSSKGCPAHFSMNANVEVFTPLSWSGSLTFEFMKESASNDIKPTPKKKREFETVFSIKGNAELNYGTRKWSVEQKFDKKTESKLNSKGAASGLAKKMFNIMEDLAFLRELDDWSKGKLELPKTFARPSIKCEITWPTLKIAGNAKNVASEKTWQVGAEYELSFSGNLIGASLKGDILDFLAYGYCPALYKIKKMAAEDLKGESFSAEIILMLEITANAKTGYDIKATGNNDKKKVEGTLKVQGGFGIKAELSVEGRAKVWRWEAYAGAGAVAQLMSDGSDSETSGLFGELSPVVVSDTDGWDWKGKIGFNGLAFYYALYAYAGVRSADSKHFTEEENVSRKKAKTSSKGGAEHKAEATKKIPLLAPWVYPDA